MLSERRLETMKFSVLAFIEESDGTLFSLLCRCWVIRLFDRCYAITDPAVFNANRVDSMLSYQPYGSYGSKTDEFAVQMGCLKIAVSNLEPVVKILKF